MKILAIGAHFDDVELGCGGTLFKHSEAGDEIHILVVTHSGYSDDTNHTRSAEDALQEGKEAAKMIGATLHTLNKETLVLAPSEHLVHNIYEIVAKINPDRVYCHRPNDYHSDHASVGFASLRATRRCPEVFCYRSSWYILDEPQDDNCFIDISDYVEQKCTLVKIFKSELEKVNYSWLEFVQAQNHAAGLKIGVKSAETYRVIKIVQ
ncbi:PIG-L deacetylase family protein [Maridesulfovibrio sp.]|uniref:PIG-L deacetylase family protein n=1 Tax=unclassified Maridesulfovibrio TaxID=2794999 RepID=UPI003AFFCE9C